MIAVKGGQASFSFAAEVPPKKGDHFLSYSDPAHSFTFSTNKVGPATITGNHVHFSGTAKLGKKGPTITFTVDAYDNSADGSSDQFFITASNGYSAGGSLTSGNIVIQ